MSLFNLVLIYIPSFIVLLTVLVFVHEMGHYLVARWNGVRIEVFSIGFGPELFGWSAKSGTRWKFCAVPLGGYVKMFGDANAASAGSVDMAHLPDQDRAASFHHKRLGQRVAIVLAGPLANYIFAVLILAGLFTFLGQPFTPAKITKVLPNTPAAAAGLKAGDLIVGVDGHRIERFEEIVQIVALRPEMRLVFEVERGGRRVKMVVVPRRQKSKDRFGNVIEKGVIGVHGQARQLIRHDPATAVWRAVLSTWSMTKATGLAIKQMFDGTRSAKDLRGPLGIGELSGQMAQISVFTFIWFMGILSLHLGLINLLPVPMLDGGHLAFYAYEAIRGKPLGERAQEYGFRIGLALVLTLMLFVTWNDIARLTDKIGFLKRLIG